MAKKSKSPTAATDAGVTYLSILTAVLCLACVVAPWYYKPMDPSMGLGWTVTRSYNLLGATDMTEGQVSWSALSETICRKSNQYTSQASGIAGLGTQLISGAVSKLASGTVAASAGVDGARLMGCGHWPSCREHVASRCAIYRMLKMTTLAAAGLFAIGALTGFLTVGLMRMEAGIKKKSKIEDARMKTMIASVVSCSCITIGFGVASAQLGGAFTRLNDTAYYPTPDKHVGFILAALAMTQACCSCSCAIYRKANANPPKEDEAPMMAGGAGGYDQGYGGGYGGQQQQYGGYQQY